MVCPRTLVGQRSYGEQGRPWGQVPVAVIAQTRSGSGSSLSVSTQIHYLYADHLDTPRVIVRASDHAVIWRWDTVEAYGNAPPNSSPTGLAPFTYNPRFPGQIHDPETQLSYNLHRSYRPVLGAVYTE